MNKVDLSDFYAETETSEARAYEHALDIEFIVHREMKRLGLSKSELANRMGISLQSLSKLLNSQPNMTLKTIAKFELALGIKIVPQVSSAIPKNCRFFHPTIPCESNVHRLAFSPQSCQQIAMCLFRANSSLSMSLGRTSCHSHIP